MEAEEEEEEEREPLSPFPHFQTGRAGKLDNLKGAHPFLQIGESHTGAKRAHVASKASGLHIKQRRRPAIIPEHESNLLTPPSPPFVHSRVCVGFPAYIRRRFLSQLRPNNHFPRRGLHKSQVAAEKKGGGMKRLFSPLSLFSPLPEPRYYSEFPCDFVTRETTKALLLPPPRFSPL